MKKFTTTIFLLLTFVCSLIKAQENYPATVTYNDGTVDKVFFKTKNKIIGENEVTFFKTNAYSSMVSLKANEFAKIESVDGQLIILSKKFKELNQDSNVILKQLTKGEVSLYETEVKNEIKYVIGKDDEFTLLSKRSDQSGYQYRKWLYDNLNSRNLSPPYYNKLSYTKDGLINYFKQEGVTFEELEGEKKIPLFNLGVLGSVGLYNYSFNSTSVNYTLDDAASPNYQIGLRTYFHIDRLQDKISTFVDVKYSTVSNDNAVGTAFPQSDFARDPIVHKFNFSTVNIEVGFQYNFHLNASTISPFIKFGPGYYQSNSFSNFESENGIITQSFVQLPDTTFNFGIGIGYAYKNTVSLYLGYDSSNDNRIIYSSEVTDVRWSGLNLLLVYNIF